MTELKEIKSCGFSELTENESLCTDGGILVKALLTPSLIILICYNIVQEIIQS